MVIEKHRFNFLAHFLDTSQQTIKTLLLDFHTTEKNSRALILCDNKTLQLQIEMHHAIPMVYGESSRLYFKSRFLSWFFRWY